MMKIRRILFCMATIAISQISMAQKVQTAAQVPALDVDKQLQYCHKQVKRALAELQQKAGSYDYTMEPRNILKGDKRKGGTAARLWRKSGVMASGQASSGWTIRIQRMRLCARLPKDIRNH